MAVDEATVRKVARLARLHIAEADIAARAADMNKILGWIDQLNEVDTSTVEPLTSVVHETLRQRPDAVTDGGYADKVLANAPAAQAGFFAVPKVVE